MLNKFILNDRITLKNRVVMAPMTTSLSNEDLTVSDEEADYYKARSKDVSIVITACTFYSPEGQGFEREFYAGEDSFIPSLKKMADAIKSQGAKAILQIFHAGRMGHPKNELVSASAVKPLHHLYVPAGNEIPTPRALSTEEVYNHIEEFYQITRRAIEAGFDGVEIHGANTYLIQQFLSPHSNRREDEFGGTLEKRTKFPMEVVKSVLKAKNDFANKDFIVGYRISPEESEEPGLTMNDSLYFIDKLSNKDIDYIHISLNHYAQPSIKEGENKEPIGKAIVEKVAGRKPVIGVGGIQTKEDADAALNKVGFDLIAIGHAMITDKDWVKKIENGESINDSIDFKNLEKQAIPQNLANTLKSVPGWFKIKE